MKNWEEIFLTFEADCKQRNVPRMHILWLRAQCLIWIKTDIEFPRGPEKPRNARSNFSAVTAMFLNSQSKRSNFLTWSDLRPPARSGNEIRLDRQVYNIISIMTCFNSTRAGFSFTCFATIDLDEISPFQASRYWGKRDLSKRALKKANELRIDKALPSFYRQRPLFSRSHASQGCVSLGKSENGFVIPDQMDSSTPKKRKIRKRIILSWQEGLEARNIYVRTIFLSYCPRIQLEWNTNNL